MLWKDKPKFNLTIRQWQLSFGSARMALPSVPGYGDLALRATTRGEMNTWLPGDVEY
jgi:hypothetical protein